MKTNQKLIVFLAVAFITTMPVSAQQTVVEGELTVIKFAEKPSLDDLRHISMYLMMTALKHAYEPLFKWDKKVPVYEPRTSLAKDLPEGITLKELSAVLKTALSKEKTRYEAPTYAVTDCATFLIMIQILDAKSYGFAKINENYHPEIDDGSPNYDFIWFTIK